MDGIERKRKDLAVIPGRKLSSRGKIFSLWDPQLEISASNVTVSVSFDSIIRQIFNPLKLVCRK